MRPMSSHGIVGDTCVRLNASKNQNALCAVNRAVCCISMNHALPLEAGGDIFPDHNGRASNQNRITTRTKSKEQVEKEPKGEPGTSLPQKARCGNNHGREFMFQSTAWQKETAVRTPVLSIKKDERTLALDSSPEKASTSLPKKRKLQMASPLKKGMSPTAALELQKLRGKVELMEQKIKMLEQVNSDLKDDKEFLLSQIKSSAPQLKRQTIQTSSDDETSTSSYTSSSSEEVPKKKKVFSWM
ncbi:hypothetical protein SRHO_G00307730 [Serrasalmus rhombeus]